MRLPEPKPQLQVFRPRFPTRLIMLGHADLVLHLE
jgi:hypothetical protein